MTALGRALLDSLDADDLDALAERIAPHLAPRLVPAEPFEEEVMLTCMQAAQRPGTHVETIRRAVRSGALRSGRVGRSARIVPADLDAWLGSSQRPSHTRRSPAPRSTRKRRTLGDALRSAEAPDGSRIR